MNESTLDNANARDALREFDRALDRLQEVLARDAKTDSLVVDASIQRFEFCVELAWKCLKKLLEDEGEEAKTPRQALQKAYAARWIDQETIWLEMLNDRNLTSHTYREDLAKEIYGRIPAYHSALRALCRFLIARYGNPL